MSEQPTSRFQPQANPTTPAQPPKTQTTANGDPVIAETAVPISEALRQRFEAIPPIDHEREERQRADEARRDAAARKVRWDELVKEIGCRYDDCRVSTFERYHPAQAESLRKVADYCANMPANVTEGVPVLLFGPCGTGKDHLLAAMMHAAIVNFGLSVAWRNGLDLYGEIRDRMDIPEKRESSLIKELSGPAVLAISDPLPPTVELSRQQTGGLSDFMAAFLLRVVDSRYRQRKPTWMTMNVASDDDAKKRIGVALVDRLSERALALHCDWPSYRGRK